MAKPDTNARSGTFADLRGILSDKVRVPPLFFNSDWTKGNFVVELPMSRYVGVLRSIVNDHVQSASISIDEVVGKARVVLA